MDTRSTTELCKPDGIDPTTHCTMGTRSTTELCKPDGIDLTTHCPMGTRSTTELCKPDGIDPTTHCTMDTRSTTELRPSTEFCEDCCMIQILEWTNNSYQDSVCSVLKPQSATHISVIATHCSYVKLVAYQFSLTPIDANPNFKMKWFLNIPDHTVEGV